MKHGVKQRKFGRVRRQRTALFRGLARALVEHGKIETTEARAKELRPFIEKLITKAKKDTPATRQHIASRLGNDTETTKKLIEDVAPTYKDRAGGYTRITKIGPRDGDAAAMAVIELI